MWNILSLCPAGQSVEVAKQITWKNALLQIVALWQVQKDHSGRTPFKCEPGKPWLLVSDSLVLPGCEEFLPEKDFRHASDSLKRQQIRIEKPHIFIPFGHTTDSYHARTESVLSCALYCSWTDWFDCSFHACCLSLQCRPCYSHFDSSSWAQKTRV